MAKMQDLTGKRFGKLVVVKLSDVKDKDGRKKWICECDCGKTTLVLAGNLRSGNSKSCGCANKANHEYTAYKTWGRQSRIYRIWRNIKYRTSHVNKGVHHNYADKNIKMCDEWKYSSETFVRWAFENGYADDLSIDRIDNNGDYTPENCRWVNSYVQQRNKEICRYIEYDGKKKHLIEWAEEYEINPATLYTRLYRLHWNIKDALKRPVQKHRSF